MNQKLADATEVGDSMPTLATSIAAELHLFHKDGEFMIMAVIFQNVAPIGSTFKVKVEVTQGTIISQAVFVMQETSKTSVISHGEKNKRVFGVYRVLNLTRELGTCCWFCDGI